MNRPSDPLQNLADALSEDVVVASPEMLAAEAAHERGDDAGLALDFDRVVARAEQQARWRRVGQWLRALAPSATLRSWRPAMAAVAGVAVIVVAGDIYLNLNVGAEMPHAAPELLERARAREPLRDDVSAERQLAPREDGVLATVPAASPAPRPPAPAAPADEPRRVRTVPIAVGTQVPNPPPSAPPVASFAGAPKAKSLRTVRIPAIMQAPSPPPAPAQAEPAPMDSHSLAFADAPRAQKRQASRPQSDAHVASAPPLAAAAIGQANADRDVVPSFAWPLRGVAKADGRGEGIDIVVPVGTDVCAAADGVVTYTSDDLNNDGNLILVRHDGGFVTAYAHVDKILVKVNERVHRGEVIAKSGSTGSVSTPLLHFEIRKGSTVVDARQYLPPNQADALK